MLFIKTKQYLALDSYLNPYRPQIKLAKMVASCSSYCLQKNFQGYSITPPLRNSCKTMLLGSYKWTKIILFHIIAARNSPNMHVNMEALCMYDYTKSL